MRKPPYTPIPKAQLFNQHIAVATFVNSFDICTIKVKDLDGNIHIVEVEIPIVFNKELKTERGTFPIKIVDDKHVVKFSHLLWFKNEEDPSGRPYTLHPKGYKDIDNSNILHIVFCSRTPHVEIIDITWSVHFTVVEDSGRILHGEAWAS